MRFLILFLGILLFARINPFVPVVKPENTLIVKPDFFKKKVIKLPKDARVLKDIVIVYQSVSGDIKKLDVKIDKNVDFHAPLVITHHPHDFSMITLNFLNLFTMYIKDKKIFIKTQDRLVRRFFLVKPFRLVLDFQRNANFLTLTKKVKNSIVKKVVVGNHEGYYRVVIYFDAKYIYKIKKLEDGVKIDLY